MLPTVNFCSLKITRLILGANPFAGFSHQNPQRDREMIDYHDIPRIKETWARAQQAGINTFITNNETPHVVQAVRQYLATDNPMQWITQVNCRNKSDMPAAIDEAVDIGCKALYFHGALVDDAYQRQDDNNLRNWCEHAKTHNIPVGVAGHSPKAHLWVNSLDIADFHAVCFYNCGSLHDGKGEKFKLADLAHSSAAIKQIQKPCIAYKIMAAGRIDPKMAFEYAFDNIKPNDVVNVGMHRGDIDNMVEQNAAMVDQILTPASPVSLP